MAIIAEFKSQFADHQMETQQKLFEHDTFREKHKALYDEMREHTNL
jgi:hypothetical protein